MSDPQQEIETLRILLAEAEQTIAALRSGQVDAVAEEVGVTPILLQVAQDRLRHSEQLFRGVFEGSLDAMLLIDSTGLCRDANPAACDLFGRSLDQLVDEDPANFYGPNFDVTAARRQLAKEGWIRGELTVVRPDRSRREAEYLTTANIRPGLTLGVLRDITDRRESEERYRRIVEGTSEGVWMYDASGTTTFVNERFAELLGYTVGEAVGQPIFIFSNESDRAAVQARLDRRLKGVGERGAVRLRRKDGTALWTSIQANSLFDADGEFAAGLALVTDASEERRANEASARLVAIVESSEDAIMSVSLDGVVTSWNLGAEKLYQYSADEMVGKSVFHLISPAGRDDERRIFERVAHGEAVRQYETKRCRRDASVVEVAVTLSPVRDAVGTVIGISKIARDLTERRKAEDALRRSEAQFQHAQKMEAIGILAGGVAHDFNNILSVILSFASMILDDLKPGDPIRADVTEISRAGDRATDLTRQLLAFSRKQMLQPRVLDLNQMVVGMEGMLRRLFREEIELSVVASRTLGRVLADPSQIEQIVMNLAVNARDAMPGGGKLTIETANAVLDEDYANLHHGVVPGQYVMLAVTDTGLGMDAATRERVFEPFFTTKEMGKGTGLGLSTVFGIVKQSHGHIWVYSEPGVGTTFKVYFPRVEHALDAVSLAPPDPRTLRGSETILLVEDEEQVRATIRAVLQRHGYHVLDAQNAGEAFLVCEQFTAKIHLLLTDVVMPRMSGRQLAERLTPMRPEMKVLYVSGYTENSVVHHGVLDAGIAFLQKPVTPNTLLRKVREVLDA